MAQSLQSAADDMIECKNESRLLVCIRPVHLVTNMIPVNFRNRVFFSQIVADIYPVIEWVNKAPQTIDDAYCMGMSIVNTFDLQSPHKQMRSMLLGERPDDMICITDGSHISVLWFAPNLENNTVFVVNVSHWMIIPGFEFREFSCFQENNVKDLCKGSLKTMQETVDALSNSLSSDEWVKLNQCMLSVYNSINRI